MTVRLDCAGVVGGRRQAIHRGPVGWGVDPRENADRTKSDFPGKYPDVRQGGVIWIVAVK